jgi:hypothetical protein
MEQTMRKITIALMTMLMMVNSLAGLAVAQPPQSGEAENIDVVHLNTIGAFSAGFILQSYGYIGVLADAWSKGVYEPELVRSMLAETVVYMRNIHSQLGKYQSGGLIAQGDQQFIGAMMEIINQLIAEAEALSAFAGSNKKEDLARFESARTEAWKNIKKIFALKDDL